MTLPHVHRTPHRTQLMVDGAPFIMLAGEVHNSSASSLAFMEAVWDNLAALHCNAALIPLYWELIEPEEGQYDFSLLDGLLAQARAREMKIALLWFGTYKNTYSTYAPAWVKTDTARFPRARQQDGTPRRAITVCCEEACRCDARAFAAVMRHLKGVDEAGRTVIMVQVENEVGLLRDAIDHHPSVLEFFAGPVPAALLRSLAAQDATLHPRVLAPWLGHGRRMAGTWREVFGPDAAPEICMAWLFARFVGRVAGAGRAEYDLPMCANAWLAMPDTTPGEYPSGGPVAHLLDIWRAAAPALDLVAPDIYCDDFAGVCREYTRAGNPLFIPEARIDQGVAAKALYALGEHGALCYAPFGAEDLLASLREESPCANPVADAHWVRTRADGARLFIETYRQLGAMLPVLTQYAGTDRARGVLQEPGVERETIELGGLRLTIVYLRPYTPEEPRAGGLIISPRDLEYLITGYGFRIDFARPDRPAPNTGVDFLEIWDGRWERGAFRRDRRLNGDEYQVCFAQELGSRQVRLYTF